LLEFKAKGLLTGCIKYPQPSRFGIETGIAADAAAATAGTLRAAEEGEAGERKGEIRERKGEIRGKKGERKEGVVTPARAAARGGKRSRDGDVRR
jgi:hypothetical protein